MRATDDGRGTLLLGAVEGTGAVQGVRVGDVDLIIGGAQDDTAWASGRGETELEKSATGEDPRKYCMAFYAKGRQQSCLVEGCPGRAATRTAMRVHFMHRHVLETVVILEEGNLPHPLCP